MKAVTRIEIVVDATHAGRVVEILRQQGLTGYSVIRGVSGSGERGEQLGDEITRVSSNNYILTTCDPDRIDDLAEALRPFLRRVGGICLLSDARWLLH